MLTAWIYIASNENTQWFKSRNGSCACPITCVVYCWGCRCNFVCLLPQILRHCLNSLLFLLAYTTTCPCDILWALPLDLIFFSSCLLYCTDLRKIRYHPCHCLRVFFYINIVFLMIPRILRKKNIDSSMSEGSSVSHKYSFCQDLIIRCPSQCLSGIDLC